MAGLFIGIRSLYGRILAITRNTLETCPMKRTLLALSLVFVLVVPLNATAAIKTGASCKQAGQTSIFAGKKYTCVKSGKKLVWNKGIAIVKPKPIATPTPTPTAEPTPTPTATPTPTREPVAYKSPTVESGNLEVCKLKESSGRRGYTVSGFPRLESKLATSGDLKWAIVPVDFEDLRGESGFYTRVQEQMDLASSWIESASEGKARISWVTHRNWIRLPGSTKDYVMPLSSTTSNNSNASTFWKEALEKSNEMINFSGVQGIQFILPKGQTFIGESAKGYFWDSVGNSFTTKEGNTVGFFTVPGVFYDSEELGRAWWTLWVKEYTRTIGVAAIGAQRTATDFQTYTIHGNTDGERELNGWQRFLIDWIPERKIYCQSIESFNEVEMTLIPLNDNSIDGYKMFILKLSETKALIIESRRSTQFACKTPTKREGVLAYIYDASLGNGQDFFEPVAPTGRALERSSCANPMSADLMLRTGDSVTTNGITIEVLAHGNLDQIKIKK